MIPNQRILLGINDKVDSKVGNQAELVLQKRLKQLGIVEPHTQERSALPVPLEKYPTSPNPNPNAQAIDPSAPVSPHLGDILSWLRKKNKPIGPFG